MSYLALACSAAGAQILCKHKAVVLVQQYWWGTMDSLIVVTCRKECHCTLHIVLAINKYTHTQHLAVAIRYSHQLYVSTGVLVPGRSRCAEYIGSTADD